MRPIWVNPDARMIILGIHWVAAMILIGGMVFHFLIFRPAFHGITYLETTRIIKRVERRFKTLRWLSLLTLLGTGIFNLLNEGDSPRLTSAYGGLLMLKLLFVIVIFALMIVYDFIIRPTEGENLRIPVQGSASSSPQTAATWIQLTILLFSLATVFVAIYLAGM